MDPGKTVRRERMIVSCVYVLNAHDDEERQYDQLDRHHNVVGARAFSHSQQQEPSNEGDNGKRRDVDQNWNWADVRGRRD